MIVAADSDIVFSPSAIAVIGVMLSSLIAAIVFIFKLYVAQITADRDSWRQLAREATVTVKKSAAIVRAAKGEAPIEDLAPVVPEQSSPPTVQQIATADLATTRAVLVAATKEMGLPQRDEALTAKADEVVEKAKAVADELKEGPT